MILQNTRLPFRPERLCDILTFLLRQCDTAKVLIHGMVIVECARVLCGDFNRLAKYGPGFAM